MASTLSELDAATAYANAWNALDCSKFVDLLAPDARYASQYVFDELIGREAISDYLCGKFKTVKSSDAGVKAVISTATAGFPGRPCVRLIQGSNDAVVVFKTQGNRIRRFDLCITELYAPAPIEVMSGNSGTSAMSKELLESQSTHSSNMKDMQMPKKNLTETQKFLLWVNDHLTMDEKRYQSFSENGVVVVCAASTAKAMELFSRARYDAVVTDLRRLEHGQKKDNAGIELAQQIRRANNHIPILIYTINIDSSIIESAKRSGATVITTNPLELDAALKEHHLIA